MDKAEEIKIINEMQAVVEQMRLDDLEEDPNLEFEMFDCNCCGKNKPLAGSVQYSQYRLCNDCVLYAETGFALNKLNDIQTLIDKMEDNRLEEICEFIKHDTNVQNN